MSNVLQERPHGADILAPSVAPHAPAVPTDAPPSAPRAARRSPLPWEPSDPARWAHLNLSDPPENGVLPKDALVPDALAFALVLPEASDPIEGILATIKIELAALAEAMDARGIAAMLGLLVRRLDVACLLLKYTDNRARMPIEPGEPGMPPGVDDGQEEA